MILKIIERQKMELESGMAQIERHSTEVTTDQNQPVSEPLIEEESFSISSCGHPFKWKSSGPDTEFLPFFLPYLPNESVGNGARWTLKMVIPPDDTFHGGKNHLYTFEVGRVSFRELVVASMEEL